MTNQYARLIDNAFDMMNSCKKDGNQWGYTYWASVVNSLLRKTEELKNR